MTKTKKRKKPNQKEKEKVEQKKKIQRKLQKINIFAWPAEVTSRR